MALSPTSSHPGIPSGGTAGGDLTGTYPNPTVRGPLRAQSGTGSPVDTVAPTAKGYIYQDTTNGAVYLAIGTTNSSWLALGAVVGNIGEAPGLVFNEGSNGEWALMAGSRAAPFTGQAYLGDAYAQWNGHGNGLVWKGNGTDGNQVLILQLGSTGQYTHNWNADGSFAPARGVQTGRQTSAALPTVQLVTATGAQIDTVSDRETHTPCTFNPGAATTATVTVALSPDNVTYSALAVWTEPAGVALDGTILDVAVRVPAGWYLKLTVNAQAVLGLTTYY